MKGGISVNAAVINKNAKLMRQIFTTMTALLALLATATGVRAFLPGNSNGRSDHCS